MSIDALLSKQNRDGGWPYRNGSSWSEPTIYATLALLSAGHSEAAGRGLQWLQAAQRPEGGWPARPGIDQSSWVTALAALLPREFLGAARHDGAIEWLLGTQGKESSRVYRLREWLLGMPTPPEQQSPGWPWIPDTAAWVGPTSLAILALRKEQRQRRSDAVTRRIDEGRKFLWNRMCREGGWNHGGVRNYGYEAEPYPETTGMALAALEGCRPCPQLQRALSVGSAFLSQCRSANALNWLRLGLRAHGQFPAGYCPPPDLAYRTVPDLALSELIAAAGENGNPLEVAG